MSMVDYVMVMLAGAASHTQAELVIGTEDMAGAYRQVPLLDSQVSVSIMGQSDRLNSSSSLGSLLDWSGSCSSQLLQVAEWMSRLLSRGYYRCSWITFSTTSLSS
jgi:hypothetical protein